MSTTLSGLAAVTGVEAEIVAGPGAVFLERIAPGAFRATDFSRCALLRDHDVSRLLGRVSSGTLTVTPAASGLRVTAHLPDTELGRETAVLVNRGDLAGMSMTFVVGSDAWFSRVGESRPIREITSIRAIYDVGPVTFPAYGTTSVAVSEPGAPRSDPATDRIRRSMRALATYHGLPADGLPAGGPSAADRTARIASRMAELGKLMAERRIAAPSWAAKLRGGAAVRDYPFVAVPDDAPRPPARPVAQPTATRTSAPRPTAHVRPTPAQRLPGRRL